MSSYLARLGLENAAWLDPAIAGSIFVLSLLVALVVHKLVFPAVLRLTDRTATNLDARMVRTTRLPCTLGIVVLGMYLALTVPLELTEGQREVVGLVSGILAVFLGVVAVAGVVSNAFGWYLDNVAPRTRTRFDLRMLPLFPCCGVSPWRSFTPLAGCWSWTG